MSRVMLCPEQIDVMSRANNFKPYTYFIVETGRKYLDLRRVALNYRKTMVAKDVFGQRALQKGCMDGSMK